MVASKLVLISLTQRLVQPMIPAYVPVTMVASLWLYSSRYLHMFLSQWFHNYNLSLLCLMSCQFWCFHCFNKDFMFLMCPSQWLHYPSLSLVYTLILDSFSILIAAGAVVKLNLMFVICPSQWLYCHEVSLVYTLYLALFYILIDAFADVEIKCHVSIIGRCTALIKIKCKTLYLVI